MKLIIDKEKIVEKAFYIREEDSTQPIMVIKVGDLFLNGTEIKDEELLSSLMQMVMTQEQLKETFQNIIRMKQSSWRDQMKKHFREAAKIGGDVFRLYEIEAILDGEVLE